MPNWCYTQYRFEGDVQKLYDYIETATSRNFMENGFGTSWLGNLVLAAGEYTEEDMRAQTVPECRGWIDSYMLKNGYLIVETETAWGPMHDVWDYVIEYLEADISYLYYADEPSCEIHETNDSEGRWGDNSGYDLVEDS